MFDCNESEFEMYLASEDQSNEFSADGSSSSKENSAEDFEESSDELREMKMVEILQIVFAKGRQHYNKLLLFGEWHVEQHHATFC